MAFRYSATLYTESTMQAEGPAPAACCLTGADAAAAARLVATAEAEITEGDDLLEGGAMVENAPCGEAAALKFHAACVQELAAAASRRRTRGRGTAVLCPLCRAQSYVQ